MYPTIQVQDKWEHVNILLGMEVVWIDWKSPVSRTSKELTSNSIINLTIQR